jgi:hypothetical protein
MRPRTTHNGAATMCRLYFASTGREDRSLVTARVARRANARNRENGKRLARAIRRHQDDELENEQFLEAVNWVKPNRISATLQDILGDFACRCDDCGDYVDEGTVSTLDDRTNDCVCDYCRDDGCSSCNYCGELHRDENGTHVDGDFYCDYCADEHFVECERCNEHVSRHNGDYACVDDNELWCLDCCDSAAYFCESRGGYYSEPTGDDGQSLIRPYNVTLCGPLGELPTDRRGCHVLGAELECEVSDRDNFAKEIQATFPPQHCHCKKDGSLNETKGVEIVTGHGTLDTLLPILHKAAELAAKHGGKSHDAKNCGLHIGLDRSQLPARLQAKIIYFWNSSANYRFLRQFARRDYRSVSWCKAKLEKATAEFLAAPQLNSSDKYEIVNTLHESHLEFRGFRGSLRPLTLSACISVVSLIASFCDSPAATPAALTAAEFVKWARASHDPRWATCVAYLANRSKSAAELVA